MQRESRRPAAAFAVILAAGAAAAATGGDSAAWRTKLTYQDRSATVTTTADGWRLATADADVAITAQAASTQTASPAFDALFALAQQELAKDRVQQIRYKAFSDGAPLDCACLVAGEMWPWVWTRDIAYATDLSLYRFDPQHARNSLEFKLSGVRAGKGRTAGADALFPVQDTGSGGSWPVSTDRIAWFLGARHLIDGPSRASLAAGSLGLLPGDAAFAGKVYKALTATLAQDRRFVYDAGRGLYRGETSFLDWREQSYPTWTKTDVVFIAESFALSTNVLYYEALQLAATMAEARHDDASAYRRQAAALKDAIERQFWREDRGLYMSYTGSGPLRWVDAYDLLGTSLAIVSGVATPEHARRALANYPTRETGTPVIWPERPNAPIYHNRAFWPFASAYALKAARALDEPSRIAHELRSILRAAALAGSNMENQELPVATRAAPATSRDNSQLPVELRSAGRRNSPSSARTAKAGTGQEQATSGADSSAKTAAQQRSTHDAAPPWKMDSNQPRSGPVINSRRQLWSVAAYLDLVAEGVFGLTDRGTIEPKLPRELVPMLFGDGSEIVLALPDRRITLVLPAQLDAGDNLLVAAATSGARADTRVQLRGTHVADSPLPLDRPFFAPEVPPRPTVERDGGQWRVRAVVPGGGVTMQLHVGEQPAAAFSGEALLPQRHEQQCISLTVRGGDGIESLPSEPLCVGDEVAVGGRWPRAFTAEGSGRYEVRLDYINRHGTVSTGITAAVKTLNVQCAGAEAQSGVVVMPHSEGRQPSTAVSFTARAGQRCTFALEDGFNMSYLQKYANYNGGAGGDSGVLNEADLGDLKIIRSSAE